MKLICKLAGASKDEAYHIFKEREGMGVSMINKRILVFDKLSLKRYKFIWSSMYDDYLKRLRQDYSLDKVVIKSDTDFEIMKKLCIWVSMQWEHSDSGTCKYGDAYSILKEAREGSRFKCSEYSTVLQAKGHLMRQITT